MRAGERVRLRWYPFCAGEIIEVLEPLKVGDIHVASRYKIKWDSEKHGISDWVSDYDLTRIVGLNEN